MLARLVIVKDVLSIEFNSNATYSPYVIWVWGKVNCLNMFDNKKTTSRFPRNESGATAIEYCMCAMFVGIAAVGAIGALGSTMKNEQLVKLSDGLVRTALNAAFNANPDPDHQSSVDPIQTGSTNPSLESAGTGAAQPAKPGVKVLPQIYITSQSTPSCTASSFTGQLPANLKCGSH